MEKIKKVFSFLKGILKGIFDTPANGKVTGCCGGYISEKKDKKNQLTK
ncbi:MAG: hypothetical protein LBV66_00735 [Elusimicrobiota bacterium]|jgi:hypothetical protein|nr:hypothetical protein [Elusimicrobiota bacterium]